MTPTERTQLADRKVQGYKRRIRDVIATHSLPYLSRRQMRDLTTYVMNVQGDAVTDPDLLVLTRLTLRGLFDDTL